ncbi:hypothetical protein B1689_04345, partial [Geobacillus sp. 44C]
WFGFVIADFFYHASRFTFNDQLSDENDFERSCRLNSEIAELASIINDLWIWYRMNQTVSMRAHQ